MADCTTPRRTDEIRASIPEQVIWRDYLNELIEKARLMKSQFGADYPREISRALQELATKEVHIKRAPNATY